MQAHPRRRPAIAGVVAEGFPTRKFVAATDAGGRPGPKLVASASRFLGLGCPKILHEVRTPGATVRRPGARGLRGPVSGPTPPAYRLRGTVLGGAPSRARRFILSKSSRRRSSTTRQRSSSLTTIRRASGIRARRTRRERGGFVTRWTSSKCAYSTTSWLAVPRPSASRSGGCYSHPHVAGRHPTDPVPDSA